MKIMCYDCGSRVEDVRKMIALRDDRFICNECVDLCHEICHEGGTS